jgi:hypothetical protein
MQSCNLHVVNLDLNDSIKFISNLIEKESKFNNLWNKNIFDEKNYNNIMRTMTFFWLDGSDYKKNAFYELGKLQNIPWYYDFSLYQDRIKVLKNISKNDLWKNYNDFNEKTSKHYIANSDTLIKYMPSGYLIPPIDKHLIDIEYIINNDNKYDEYDNIVENKDSSTFDAIEEEMLVNKLKEIFDKLDKNNDNVLKSSELRNMYYITNDNLEKFSNDDYEYHLWLQNNQGRNDNELTRKEFTNKYMSSYYSKDISFDNLYKYLNTKFTSLFEKNEATLCPIEVDQDADETNEPDTDDITTVYKNISKHKEKTLKDKIISIGLWTIFVLIILIISLFIIKTFM